MTTYYADLDLTGTGGDGTELDPWHADTFQTQVDLQLPSGSIVKVKGSHDYGSVWPDSKINIYGFEAKSITIENWEDAPWRIKCARFSVFNNSVAKNGIVEAYGTGSIYNGMIQVGGKVYDCFLIANAYLTNSNESGITPMDINGCTIVTPEIWGSSYGCGGEIGNFKDSKLSGIIDVSVPNSFDAVGSDNCVFIDAVIPGIGVHTHKQTGWTPPSWPAWNAAQSEFSSDILSVGINTPPEPGNPPYIGYEYDLWGNARTGIGAEFMGSTGTAPSISVQPSSLSKIVGQSASFSVTASGTAPLTYQWMKDASNIADATVSSYTIASVITGNSGSYNVDVSNGYGFVDSSVATLTVLVPASINTPPVSLTRIVGQSALFSVDATGTLPLNYKWTLNDTTVSTDYTYSIASVSSGNAGTYIVTVDNTCVSPVSADATLTVLVPASISVQPVSLTKIVGDSATFSVTAAGTTPFTYQWKKGVTPITDATFSSYSIAAVSTGNSGSYKVTVDNTCVSPIDSSAATLTVHVQPSITGQPQSLTKLDGQSASFSVTATGDPTLIYQWYLNTSPVSSATSPTYTISAVHSANAGSYVATVSNGYGTDATSNAAILTVHTPPSITSQPSSVIVAEGGSVIFTAGVAGDSPSFKWYKNGVLLPGASSTSYMISPVGVPDAGSYKMVASNAYGDATTNAATLTVNAVPPVIVNQPVAVTTQTGTRAMFSVYATSIEPTIYYQWYQNNLPISGATDATYTIPSVYSSLTGQYWVKVSDTYSSTVSSSASLTITDTPLPHGWTPQRGQDCIGPTGLRYTSRLGWIMDGTNNTPTGAFQIIDI